MKEIKYHSIGQFRNVIKDVQYHYGEGVLPKLNFTGTVKVHGTNASIVITKDGLQYPQSRNNVLTIESDNCGFAQWHYDNTQSFSDFYKLIGIDKDIVIYGEWAGKGIQKGVAVSDVDKFFYIFGVKVINDDKSHFWLKDYPFLSRQKNNIIDSRKVMLLNIEIDFNNPADIQNKLVELTNNVEKQCPVGKYLGVDGVGEGIVWEYITDKGEMFYFKVKGEKHSVSKVKKLASVDTEKLNSIREFIDYAVTENRMEQAFLEVCNNNPDRKFLGSFIKWVSTDVNKEEQDTMKDNDLTMKDIGSSLSKTARNWFFSKELI